MRALRVLTASMAILFVGLAAGCSSDPKPATDDASGYTEPDKPFARLEPAAFADRMKEDDAVLINVHIPYEGELEQTDAFIPYDKILADESKLPKDKDSEILLYCRSGRMSEEAGAALNKAGYTNVSHLEGGMKAWENAGRQLIQNPAHATETPMEAPGHG